MTSCGVSSPIISSAERPPLEMVLALRSSSTGPPWTQPEHLSSYRDGAEVGSRPYDRPSAVGHFERVTGADRQRRGHAQPRVVHGNRRDAAPDARAPAAVPRAVSGYPQAPSHGVTCMGLNRQHGILRSGDAARKKVGIRRKEPPTDVRVNVPSAFR